MKIHNEPNETIYIMLFKKFVSNIDTLILSDIMDLHMEMIRFQVCNELRVSQLQYQDRYYVSTELDNFFDSGRRGSRPLIPQTIMIDIDGFQVITEPISINRRNRRQTLDELVTF